MLYFESMHGHDVWVTVEQPLCRDQPAQKYVPSSRFLAAFRLDTPPSVITGEYLRDEEGALRWFDSEDEALAAAFAAAENRITQRGSS